MPLEPYKETQTTSGYLEPYDGYLEKKPDFVPKGNVDIEKEYYFDQYQTGRKENSYFGVS